MAALGLLGFLSAASQTYDLEPATAGNRILAGSALCRSASLRGGWRRLAVWARKPWAAIIVLVTTMYA
jgi:hypothetical protein